MPHRLGLLLTNLLCVSVALAGCSAAGVLNAVTSRADYTVVSDVRFREGPRGTYDLYVPEEVGEETPVVVFFYGGSWDMGSKEMYLFVGQSLASEGVIVAIPDYRLYPQVTFPAFVEDGAEAVGAIARAVRQTAYGVPAGDHPLFLMGHSAGAQIAALLALDEDYLREAGLSTERIAGFIGLAGPYDFLPLEEERYKRIFPEESRPASQPINFVDGSEPPMLLITGTADATVDPRNTRSLAAAVRQAGGVVETAFYEGVDHVGAVSALATAIPWQQPDIRRQVLAFIERFS